VASPLVARLGSFSQRTQPTPLKIPITNSPFSLYIFMRKYYLIAAVIFVLIGACRQDPNIGPLSPNSPYGKLDSIAYNPTAFPIVSPNGLPTMPIPDSNPTTVEGIKLGRLLFYDNILSGDFSMSCASCHEIEKAFTDGLPTAVGIAGIASRRNSMSLINVGYNWKPSRQNNFNWDGHFATLEAQVLAPVEHPLELNISWDTVVARLQAHPHYPRLFRKAFGIDYINQIDKQLAAKALAQFLRTLNSAGAQYDASQWQAFQYLSDAEERGLHLFMGDSGGGGSIVKDAECGHCHNATRNFAIFARNDFSNNGLDSANTFSDFPDYGLGAITGRAQDNGKFREVSLRNIGLTAPYMHDGRFSTLEQVLDHYAAGGHPAPNLASEMAASQTIRTLTAAEKTDIIAFLHALTDTSYVNKTEWQDPFLVEPNPW
jgi:cytochrome c peroxidase